MCLIEASKILSSDIVALILTILKETVSKEALISRI